MRKGSIGSVKNPARIACARARSVARRHGRVDIHDLAFGSQTVEARRVSCGFPPGQDVS
jgi:hypothetical protein